MSPTIEYKGSNKLILLVILFVLSCGVLYLEIENFTTFINATNVDFFHYWVNARIFVTGKNPYDLDRLFELKNAYSPDQAHATGTWHPSWALLFIMPFGLPPYLLAHALGIVGGITLFITCAFMLWNTYGGQKEKFLFPLLFIVTISPLILSIYEGQINILIRAGLPGFLFFERRNNLFLAGKSIILMTIKPHILCLFRTAATILA
jgi:hypothetical protein